MAVIALALASAGVRATDDDAALPDAWMQRVEQVALQAARAANGAQSSARVDVQVGSLDPRLRLAPCEGVDVYLAPGYRAWGSTRVGLRCVSGPKRWNVFVPLTVRVFAPAVHLGLSLASGTVLGPEHLRLAEADWAAADSPAFEQPDVLVGRTLQRTLPAGSILRESDLRKRQWFAIGDIVRIVAIGRGFSVTADGVALSPGIEGQTVRVRTEAGRVVTGVATAERRVEVRL